MAKNNFKLHGMTPHTATLAEESDISPFASLDGMSGVTIANILLYFPTIMKYLDGSWAPLEAKVMRWPNGFSRLMGELCQGDPYDCLQLPKYTVQLKKRNKMCLMH